ncbi:MAG: hypothetical protein HKP30_06845 [Myxococcales bacterium]|nr:hypothetical protein [Myxococcales bacterium]
MPAVLPVGQFESINRLDAAASDRVSASDLDPCDLLLWSTRSPDGARLSLMALAPLAPPVALAHADVRGHIQPLGYPVLALAFLFDAVTFPIQYVVGKTMSKTVMPH